MVVIACLNMLPHEYLMTDSDRVNLLEWYRANRRPLPWRANRDPYRIWISEVMLQQTTVEAVKPYFERFLTAFPTLNHLAKAPLEQVLENWAGLGYYSRARNLHKAAKTLVKLPRFPQSYQELLELPGFGPYTSRAVSSIAFGEKVGVLDGNVIRVVSRKLGEGFTWWQNSERQKMQDHVDQFSGGGPSDELNQGLMELGATICTPANPKCILCPWLKTCEGRKKGLVEKLPLKKEKRAREIWLWQPEVRLNSKKLLWFEKNLNGPFLRNELLPPGEFRQLKKKPSEFDLRHSITHHDIYIDVQIQNVKGTMKNLNGRWLAPNEVAKSSPFSIVKKVLHHALQDETKVSRKK